MTLSAAGTGLVTTGATLLMPSARSRAVAADRGSDSGAGEP